MEYKLDTKIAERKNKEVFKEDGKTIKLFVKGYSKADILNEALTQARVEEGTNLKIPKLLEVTKINDRWALISEYIEGDTLEELMHKHPKKLDEYLEIFVNIQLSIHSKQVPLLNRIKDKFKRKLLNANNIDENTKYELLQRLEGMKDHIKLGHGDYTPSNIVITEDGDYYILDWAHATQGNASADCARTFLTFSLHNNEELAEKYLDLFSNKSGIEKSHIQRWIPIVAATQLTKNIEEEKEILKKWIDIVDYE
jgi:thiamine kinase-like enzyme